MSDDKKTPAADAQDDAKPAKLVKEKYTVIGAAIAPFGNLSDGDPNVERLYQPGETVELTPKQAKHYNDLGRLAPYIPGV